METKQWKRAPLFHVILAGLACGLMVGGLGYFTIARDLPAAIAFGVATAVCAVAYMQFQYHRHGV
jgi:hypothetical protein